MQPIKLSVLNNSSKVLIKFPIQFSVTKIGWWYLWIWRDFTNVKETRFSISCNLCRGDRFYLIQQVLKEVFFLCQCIIFVIYMSQLNFIDILLRHYIRHFDIYWLPWQNSKVFRVFYMLELKFVYCIKIATKDHS